MKILQTLFRVAAISVTTYLSYGPATAQTPEKVLISSHTPQDYSEILSGKHRQSTAQIHGYLSLPRGNDKYPAVIIIPGSGGYQQWMQDTFAKRLNEVGIATLIVDSFTGRGIAETATNQAAVPMAASVVDGFAALQTLAQRGDIDADRVGVTGFSRGGVVSMFSQDRRLVEAVMGNKLQFAAHLPIYPGCSTTFEKPEPTSARSLFMLGEKDDYTPAAQCLAYIDRLKAAGAKVSSKIYPGAYHGWISNTNGVVYLPRVQVYSKCDARIDNTGIIREIGSGATSADGWSAFVARMWRHCGKSGANYGANEKARTESLSDMVDFFKETLLGK